MSRVRITESSVGEFLQLTLQNELLALTLIPRLGGKINSIRDLRTGREWLWTNPYLQYHTVNAGASYIREGDTGGWDECFPTVAPCTYPLFPWKNLALPDHGEVWSQPWHHTLDVHPSDGGRICTEIHGRGLPYVFHRCVRLAPGKSVIRVDYRVENESDSEIGFIWSAHPLFALEQGMRLVLPETAVMRVGSTIPPGLWAPGDRYEHPLSIQILDEAIEMPGLPNGSAGIAFKLWSEPLVDGWAELQARDGVFRFIMDPSLPPQIGIWANWGGWSGTGKEAYYNLGLEPCVGAQDSLEEAVEQHRLYATLPSRGIRTWWLEAHVEAS